MNATADMLDALLARPARRDELMRRYLRGQLEEPLLEALEIRLLEDPALLAEFEAEQDLRDAMRTLDPRAMPASESPASQRSPVLRGAAGLAVAALLGAALPGLGWWRSAQTPANEPAAVEVIALDPQRAGGAADDATRLTLDPGADRFVLRLPAPNRPGAQALRIRREDDGVVAQLEVVADADGWANLLLATADFPPGPYRLEWAQGGAQRIDIEHRGTK